MRFTTAWTALLGVLVVASVAASAGPVPFNWFVALAWGLGLLALGIVGAVVGDVLYQLPSQVAEQQYEASPDKATDTQEPWRRVAPNRAALTALGTQVLLGGMLLAVVYKLIH